MQADFSIECGAEDECLEIPWASEGGALRYVDLKQNPELIENLEESRRFLEIAEFLRGVNSQNSAFQSAKCDAGFARELTVDDEPFATTGKFWSYVDVLFASRSQRSSFQQHETTVRNLTASLRDEPEMPGAIELLVRRCYFSGEIAEPDGFYLTCYAFGYGDNEAVAREQWAIVLRRLGTELCSVGQAEAPTST